MYEYRFNENRIERWPLAALERPAKPAYSNSAESTPWESAGSSPDSQPLRPAGFVPDSHQLLRPGSSPDSQPLRHPLHRTSPVSPKDFTVITPPPRRRSALRKQGRPSSSRPTKTVQWVSDLKKRPQDISSDRKIVKVQVKDITNHKLIYLNYKTTCNLIDLKKVLQLVL